MFIFIKTIGSRTVTWQVFLKNCGKTLRYVVRFIVKCKNTCLAERVLMIATITVQFWYLLLFFIVFFNFLVVYYLIEMLHVPSAPFFVRACICH